MRDFPSLKFISLVHKEMWATHKKMLRENKTTVLRGEMHYIHTLLFPIPMNLLFTLKSDDRCDAIALCDVWKTLNECFNICQGQ